MDEMCYFRKEIEWSSTPPSFSFFLDTYFNRTIKSSVHHISAAEDTNTRHHQLVLTSFLQLGGILR